MPYIPKVDRAQASHTPVTAGQLNYAITALVAGYLRRKGLSYQTINDVVGALTGANTEFERRIVAPFEDTARARNGDVYSVEGVNNEQHQDSVLQPKVFAFPERRNRRRRRR